MSTLEHRVEIRGDRIEDGQSSRIVRDFLEKLAGSLAKNSFEYFLSHKKAFNERDHPLRYNERQMYSLFASSLHDITKIHLSEVSVDRTPGSKNTGREAGGGRVDFYAHYRGTEIYMELKRVSVGIGDQGTSEKFRNAWKSVRDQVVGLGKHVKNWSDKPARIGLLIVLPYKSKKGEIEKNLEARWQGWGCVDNTSMVIEIKLPEEMWVCDCSEGMTEFVPSIYLLAYVRLPYKKGIKVNGAGQGGL